jgi:hypothetical protein
VARDPGSPQQQRILHQRRLERAAQLGAPVVASAHLGHAAQFAARALGDHADRAARGVLAKQRALRAAQHFDAFDIQQLEQCARCAREIHPIDVDPHRRVLGQDEVRLSHAADEDLREVAATAAVAGGGELHVGCGGRDPAQIDDAPFAQGSLAQRRDRNRRLLQVLAAPLCRDHDLLGFGVGALCPARRACPGMRGEQCGERGRTTGSTATKPHDFPDAPLRSRSRHLLCVTQADTTAVSFKRERSSAL